METERCPLDLATGRSEGKWMGEETRLEWIAKRVGGEGMEEIHVNSPMGQHSPAHMPEILEITIRVAGTSFKGFLLATS